jgi:putative transposase
MPSLFASSREKQEKNEEDLTAALYQQIGQLKVELDWVKKNLVLAVAEKKELVEAHASSNRDCSAV